MFNTLTRMSVSLVQKYLPSPFVFSALLTLGVLLAGIFSTGQSLPAMVQHWSSGFWTLLGFAMQMSLIFVTGHALASAPIINRQLDRLAGLARTPGQAIIMVTLVALVGCWVNWGFGLVIGAVFARALARKVDGVDYPLLVASAYSGFLVWHGGLAGSIPLSMATGGPDLARITAGVLTDPVSITETLFSPLNLTIVVLLFIGLPLLNRAMHPRQGAKIADPAKLVESRAELPARETPAQRLDDSRILGLALVAMAGIYLFNHFATKGFVLGLDVVIAIFLFSGLLMHGTPERYMRAVDESVRGIGIQAAGALQSAADRLRLHSQGADRSGLPGDRGQRLHPARARAGRERRGNRRQDRRQADRPRTRTGNELLSCLPFCRRHHARRLQSVFLAMSYTL